MTQYLPDTDFGSSILYEDRLPIKVESYRTEPESSELLRIGLLNDEVLRMVLSLDEVIATDKGEASERNTELQRLEFKVNIMLEMLGELYTQSLDFPEAIPVKLGAGGAAWLAGEHESTPEVGSYQVLHIYLSRRYPRPLVLFAQVRQVRSCEAGEKWVELALLAMPQQTQDHLERFVFRQHRRLVAFSRRK